MMSVSANNIQAETCENFGICASYDLDMSIRGKFI